MTTRKLNKILAALVCGLSVPGMAWATIPSSDVTSMLSPTYGFYTTSDPTCQTGWVRMFVSATPLSANLVTGPMLGTGSVASTINCALIIIESQISFTYAAGTYTSSSVGGSDSVCDSGGTVSGYSICGNPMSYKFPAEVITDAASVGLNLTSSGTCSNGTTIVPAYFSTDSACYDNTALDPSGTCGNGGGTQSIAFEPPTSAGDTSHGLKLAAGITPTADLTFSMSLSGTVGNDGGSCSDVSPPAMTIHN